MAMSVRALSVFRLLRPSSINFLVRDRIKGQHNGASCRRHLDETMDWLCRAQDNGGGFGVSSQYSLIDGWLPPYPETTGYIIPTFFDYATLTLREEFRIRAQRMADWEIQVQLPSGAVQAGSYRGQIDRAPAVFNTGQVILGWCRAFVETGEERYLQAASRAGDWLVSVQSADGAWRLTWPNVDALVRSFDVRVAWSLLELHNLVRRSCYRDSAVSNLEWTMRQQHPDGWFEHNAFNVFAKNLRFPLTHTIAYVMEGLWESGRLLEEPRYLDAVERTAGSLLLIFEKRGALPGEFDIGWKPAAFYRCLTGDAQIAAAWLRVFARTLDKRYMRASLRLIDSIQNTQSLTSRNPGIRGGIKGSEPTSGGSGYARLKLPNWGAKFVADLLMLKEQLLRDDEVVYDPVS